MRTTERFLVAAFAATILLLAMTGSAAALRSLEFGNTLINLLSTAFTFEGFANVICEFGLSTTLTKRAFPKTANAVVGRVTAIFLRCNEGTAVVLNVPWNVKYKSFSGSLPSSITGLTLQIERVQVRLTNGLSCLFTAEITGLDRVSGGTLGTLENRPWQLENVTTEGFCTRENLHLSGALSPTNGPITIRLV